jgi:hypothetical protein
MASLCGEAAKSVGNAGIMMMTRRKMTMMIAMQLMMTTIGTMMR